MAVSPEPPRYYAAARTSYSYASSSSAVASCVVAALFLLLADGGAAAALFLLFRPHAPAIAVTAVQLPSFAYGNGTAAFTFQQLASVRNPNRAPLAHYDSSLGEVGSMYIPAGQIDGGRAQYMATSFNHRPRLLSLLLPTGDHLRRRLRPLRCCRGAGAAAGAAGDGDGLAVGGEGQGDRAAGVHPPRRGRQGVPHRRLAGRRPRARLPVLTAELY